MNKLTLLKHLSGADGVYEVGDTIELNDSQSLAFIKKEIAEFKTKKELDAFIKKAEKIETEKVEADAKVKAILEESIIKNELNELYLAVVLKEAELNGEVLKDDEVLEAVENIAKRDAMGSKETKGK